MIAPIAPSIRTPLVACVVLALGIPAESRGQARAAAATELDSLQVELEAVTRALSEEIRTTVETSLRSGRDDSVIRAEVARSLESRRTRIESLRGQIARVTAQQTGRVAGVVTHAETLQPIRSVVVSIDGTARRVVSGPDGTFTMAALPEGTHTIVAQRLGFAEVRRSSVTVTPGSTTTVNIAMEPVTVALQSVVATGVVNPVDGVRSPVAVGRVDREMMPVAQASPVQNLEGRVAGLRMSRPSGQAVADTLIIRLRSPTSLTVGDALTLVDGVIVSPSSPVVLGQRFVAGLGLVSLNPALGAYFDVDVGVLVTEVTDPSPGADAGVRPGDVLVTVAGRPVGTVDEVRRAFSGLPSDSAATAEGVSLGVVREGGAIVLRVPR